MLTHFGSLDAICHVTIRPAVGGSYRWPHRHQPSISHGYGDIMRHLLDAHIPIITALDTILGSLGEQWRICHFG